MNTNRIFSIVDGPSRDRLFDALKYRFDEGAYVPLQFKVVFGTTMPGGNSNCANVLLRMKDVHVLQIQHEDGSGYSFNIEGTCFVNPEHSFPKDEELKLHVFKAYYHAGRREGHIQFFPRE